MQRKALKQLGKVTQWTNEKVFSGEKTSLSDEFTEYEKEVDVRRVGIERLHGTSLPFFQQLTKVKPTGDPYPPSGSGKEKILHTEALGLVMIDYGGDVGGVYGDGLGKYGRARCKLAIAQEEFGARLSEGYIGGMETALAAVNDYKTFRKKLDSRRLALDSAISRLQGSKKEKDIQKLELEVEEAKERFEEIEEETKARLAVIQEQEERQWSDLTDLLDAEYEYFAKCKDILEDLRSSWPTGEVSSSANRPRAKSNASARSLSRQATTRNFARASSEEEDAATPNRSRSQSNASSTGKGGGKRSMLPSFGSLGKKGGLASMAGSSSKRKSFGKEKDRYADDTRQALHSDADDDEYEPPRSPLSVTGRTRSQTTLSTSRVSLASDGYGVPPPMRRTHTTPVRADGHYVKALYDFAGGAADELSVRAGDIIEVKQEVSEDWYIGESSGRSGLFPVAYCEEYIPTPTTARAPPMPTSVPTPRNLPPAAGAPRGTGAGGQRAMPPMPTSQAAPASPMDPYATSDSEFDHGFSDAEHTTTAHLTSSGQAPGAHSRPPASGRKPAPPPPPSRRSQSSSNLLSSSAGASFGASYLSPPQPSYARRTPSPPEGSPFAGSEDEEEIFGGGGRTRSATIGASPTPVPAPTNGAVHGLGNGLGGLHLGQGAGEDAAVNCRACSCEDFTQNVFKPKGTCSTCFHQH